MTHFLEQLFEIQINNILNFSKFYHFSNKAVIKLLNMIIININL